LEWSKKYVERRGATFPEISGHFGSTQAKGQWSSLGKTESVMKSKAYKNPANKNRETPEILNDVLQEEFHGRIEGD